MFKVDYDWLSDKDNIFDSDQILNYVKLGLNNGGFVSGGGARTIGRVILNNLGILTNGIRLLNRNGCIKPIRFAKDYFRIQMGRPKEHNKYWKATSGDIDIFFKDSRSANKALSQIKKEKKSNLTILPTEAGWGYDIATQLYRLQFITKNVGTPEEITSTFDIVNATCWLDSKSFYYSEKWFDLENQNMIGLQGPCDKANLPWRVSKWIWKGHYSTISPDSQKKYVENCLETMKLIKSGNLQRFEKNVKPQNLKSKLRDVQLDKFTSENLIYISMLLDDYELPEIWKMIASRK